MHARAHVPHRQRQDGGSAERDSNDGDLRTHSMSGTDARGQKTTRIDIYERLQTAKGS
jgi:hypothetical protein